MTTPTSNHHQLEQQTQLQQPQQEQVQPHDDVTGQQQSAPWLIKNSDSHSHLLDSVGTTRTLPVLLSAVAAAAADPAAPPRHLTRKIGSDNPAPTPCPEQTSIRSPRHHVSNKDTSDPIANTPLRERDPNTSAPTSAARRLLRKPGPGLLARLRLLDTRRRSNRSSINSSRSDDSPNVGRIPESQLRQLDQQLGRVRQIVVDRRGQPWRGQTPQEVQLSLPGPADFGTAPATATATATNTTLPDSVGHLLQPAVMAALMHEDSDLSSIISTSDRFAPSDSEGSDVHVDTQKYRLPDVGKSRGSSRNGFVLQDGTVADRDWAPTPPPKDQVDGTSAFSSTEDLSTGPNQDSYFNPYALTRTASIYTLSRASFSNQLSQLTSIKLPDASSLSSSISSIPTSAIAVRTLNEAAEQIKIWIKKALEVLNGLDAEDDVEWAAAGGRDGLGEVDDAIGQFDSLIKVYISAIEDLEARPDIGSLSGPELEGVVDRMEKNLTDWENVKISLQAVKEQVELAMEWEELWNSVLGDIGFELENLNRLIFEMEERRHKNSVLDAMAEPGQGLDIKELETIVEEAPVPRAPVGEAGNRLSMGFDGEEPEAPQKPQEDSNLLALFARMQPLRASLDFTPMRLSSFLTRAKITFPSGCDELERRMEFLDTKYKKLESDAESLRKELGEDRWVLIFRKAGKQALRMCESVERSVSKLRDALDDGAQHTNAPALTKKIESYEAKREHYGPAIQQVLAIIDRGVQTRLTVNGEILRLQSDMQRRWADVDALLKGMDFALEQLNIGRAPQLRDSVSTILSEQRSVASSTFADTPGSSPASSVVLLSRHSSELGTSTPFSGASKSRQSSFTSSTTTRGKRYSSMPVPMANQTNATRKTPLSRSSTSNLRAGVSGVSARLYPPPTPSRSVSRNSATTECKPDKPRWNSSTSMRDTTVGHNFKPLHTSTPSPYAKHHDLRSQRSFSTLHTTGPPIPSPLGRDFNTSRLSRPPSTVPPSTPSQPQARAGAGRPRMPSSATTSGIPLSQSRPKSSMNAIAVTPAGQRNMPRASMYGLASPLSPSSEYGASGSNRASVASSASTSTLTEMTGQRKMSHAPDTPVSNAPSDLDGRNSRSEMSSPLQIDDSPSSRSTVRASRPDTAMASGGNRRSSMLPQPKRVLSGIAAAISSKPSMTSTKSSSATSTATAAATAAMSGRTTPANGRNSRMGKGAGAGEVRRWR